MGGAKANLTGVGDDDPTTVAPISQVASGLLAGVRHLLDVDLVNRR